MGPNARWAEWTTDGRQWATICVATAKSEDGFRKAQQLTEEATETPSNAVVRLLKLVTVPKTQDKGMAAMDAAEFR